MQLKESYVEKLVYLFVIYISTLFSIQVKKKLLDDYINMQKFMRHNYWWGIERWAAFCIQQVNDTDIFSYAFFFLAFLGIIVAQMLIPIKLWCPCILGIDIAVESLVAISSTFISCIKEEHRTRDTSQNHELNRYKGGITCKCIMRIEV